MTTVPFAGVFTALITPFRDDRIDEPALRSLVEYQIANGIAGLVPCGTTGEAATMSEAEQARVIDIVLEQAAGRIPVIAGVGGNSTATTIERARRAAAAGVDGLLVVVPYYNKPTQAGMSAHFEAVADASTVPVMLYNVPGRTGVCMVPGTTLALARHPNITAIKEASENLDAVTEIVAQAPPGFNVLSGDDSLTLPMLAVGATGVVSVATNIVPGPVAELVGLWRSGQVAEARARHLELFDLFRAMFIENNPAAVKRAAETFGLCGSQVRLPLTPLSDGGWVAVEAAIRPWRPAQAAVA